MKFTLALVGSAVAMDRIQINRRELTTKILNAQRDRIHSKFVGQDQIDIKDFANVQYFIQTEIGTPSQKFTVIPDTGSSDLWVYSAKCQSVPCLSHPVFSPEKSSTYKKDGQQFSIQYGSGAIAGYLGQDQVKLGSVSTGMKFGEVTWTLGDNFVYSEMAGILGLGYEQLSESGQTFFGNADIEDKSFTFVLKNNPEQSELTFPGFDQDQFSVIGTHNVIDKRWWTINLTGLGQQNRPQKKTRGITAIVDTGTSLIVGPEKLTNKWVEGITVKSDCSDKPNTLPDVTVEVDGKTYTLTQEDYIVTLDDGTSAPQCQLGIVGELPSQSNQVILGDVFIRKFPSVFNLNNDTVSFLAAKNQIV